MISSPEASPDREFGPYRLLSVIAEGGMGTVYRALSLRTGEHVALKTVRSPTPPLLGALRSEIATLRAIRHPGVVQVIDHGIEGGVPWYAMQLLEGRTLATFNHEIWPAGGGSSAVRTTTLSTDIGPPRLATAGAPTPLSFIDRQGEPPRAAVGRLTEALALYRKLCVPLAYIHSHGIVHRDLKPSNVFVDGQGNPTLVDFGLITYARGSIGRESLMSASTALGTLGYLSPEQAQGRLVDARADLYSLGCMLYETITGQPPFLGDTKEVLRRRQLEHDPVPPSQLVTGVVPKLDAVVLGLLAKSPQERIGYAADVSDVLSTLLGTSDDVLEANYLYRPQIAGRQELLAALRESAQQAAGGRGEMILLA